MISSRKHRSWFVTCVTALLAWGASYAYGADAKGVQFTCASCHRSQAATQPSTSMHRALAKAADAPILKEHPALKFAQGSFSYTIQRKGDQSIYTVNDGTGQLSVPIGWAFGLGAAGQTYVYEYNGNLYESRVSFYNELNGLDITMGAQNGVPKNLEEALGRRMTNKDKTDCFRCHATGQDADFTAHRFDQLQMGILCERCHTGAQDHMEAIRSGDAKKAMAVLKPLKKYSSEDISEFCGACHRTWSQIATDGPRGVLNVRFPPYRLTNSKCYDALDQRISCVACHDPHRPSEQAAKVYDSKCQACHSPGSGSPAATKICRVAKSECVTCHMPKYEIPGSHHQFVDHQIRIARKNEPYPN